MTYNKKKRYLILYILSRKRQGILSFSKRSFCGFYSAVVFLILCTVTWKSFDVFIETIGEKEDVCLVFEVKKCTMDLFILISKHI